MIEPVRDAAFDRTGVPPSPRFPHGLDHRAVGGMHHVEEARDRDVVGGFRQAENPPAAVAPLDEVGLDIALPAAHLAEFHREAIAFLALAERLFEAALLRRVATEREHVIDLIISACDRHAMGVEDDLATLGDDGGFEALHRTAEDLQRHPALEGFREECRQGKLRRAPSHHGGGNDPEELFPGGVRVGEAPFCIEARDEIRRAVEDGLELTS